MKAYFDSFAGLVPCRIVAVGDWNDPSSLARVQYSATRGAYKRGQFETWPLRRLVPRKAVFIRSGQYRIRSYSWGGKNV
jgi:hypothetical protein